MLGQRRSAQQRGDVVGQHLGRHIDDQRLLAESRDGLEVQAMLQALERFLDAPAQVVQIAEGGSGDLFGTEVGGQYPCRSPTQQRWFMVRVSRIEASDPPRYVVAHDDVTALKLAQEALRMLATTDELTGVANRRSFMQALGVEFERLRRHPSLQCSVLALDLDHFKHVNDTWGHAAGDAVLKHVARVVSGHTRVGDVLGRTEGEEFTILLPDTALDEAEALSERLRLQVSLEPLQFDGHAIPVTVSVGIALLTASDTEAGDAVVRADRAL